MTEAAKTEPGTSEGKKADDTATVAKNEAPVVQGTPLPGPAKADVKKSSPSAAPSKPKEGKKKGANKEPTKEPTPPPSQTPPPGSYQQPPPGPQYTPPPGQGPPPNYYPPPEPEYHKVYAGYPGSYNYYPKANNDNLFAGLCYLFGWIVSLVVLLAVKPQSPWLRFHAIQAIGLGVLLSIAYVFLIVFAMVIPCLLPLVIIGVQIIFIVFAIRCFLGYDTRMPLLADFIEKNFV